ncbi:exodeoxyribonuclease V subunit alpha [Neisseriaceae bacterium TC5R-5]|nr:exodeoxyribonuclease V subunit alpha [Neisseriaceae bacterium TC5R-5]
MSSTHVLPSLLASELIHLFRRLDPTVPETLLLLVTELVQANQVGHVCLPLALRPERQAMLACKLVGRPGDYAPLILDEAARLYFARHWFDEQNLAKRLAQLAAQSSAPDPVRLRQCLAQWFPASPTQQPDQQKLAAALATRQHLLVISGGPGTGKTTTVMKLLALLASLSPRPLVMSMAAPTGKAAARLAESVRQARTQLVLNDSVQQQLPQQAQTLHRLLGLRPGMTMPRHHAANPLALDVLVLDEASMIDLSLMAQTVAALPSQARLILLGDRDQLSSVEAGAVLGDLSRQRHYRRETLNWLQQVVDIDLPPEGGSETCLSDCVVWLTHSHRFGADSGIGELARRVNAGEAVAALKLLQDPAWHDVCLLAQMDEEADWQRRQAYWQLIEQDGELSDIQQAFSDFMLLVAERQQVTAHNQQIERKLERLGLKSSARDWYAGRPVMISENDYGLGLFNGDIGFTVQRADGLRVAFPGEDGGWREFAPGRLPAHDTVYAMTVHKSQGSEFTEVGLLLPVQAGANLHRSLIYTAITRAREQFSVFGSSEVWLQAIQTAPQRYSGLADRLAGVAYLLN